MELTAALEGLATAPRGSEVELITDSTYVSKAITDGWLEGCSGAGGRPRGASR